MSSEEPSAKISLFELLTDELNDLLPVVTYTKATLVHLSHSLEDIVLREQLPALVFTGFQRSSYWEAETARYTQLANVAQQVTVFAGDELPEEQRASQLHITLEGDDPLRQEWFLAILSSEFSVVLCGQDNLTPTLDEGLREFNTFWSFEPAIVNKVLDTLEQVVEQYRPERIGILRQARREMPPIQPDPRLITRFTLEMLRFEEKLSSTLRRQQEQFRQVADAISHQIYVMRVDTDLQVEIEFVSPNIERLTGYPPSRFMQDPHFIKSLVVDEDRTTAESHMWKLANGSDHDEEYRIRHHDGRVRRIHDTGRVRYDPLTGDKMIYGLLHDITQQHQAEKMLREYETLRMQLEQERQLGQMRGRFMTTVSHEFRTPLATILSSAENLLHYMDRMPPQDRLRRLHNIRDQVLHLRGMLDDVNTLIESESGQVTFNAEPINLRLLAGEVMEAVAAACNDSHRMTLSFEGENRPVEADPRLVRQILSNLLQNAVKYSPADSHITLDLTLSEGNAVFRVTDEGIGIPEDDQPHLFEPFFRGSNVSSTSGTGLGLKIVSDSVELHGGSVRFTSTADKGTTFVVTLPVEYVEAD